MDKCCRNCKHFKNNICNHPDLEQSKDDVIEVIQDHVEYAFDGDIQSSLQETIDQYCKHLTATEKEDLIASICTCCSNYLSDPSNMNLEDIGFSPDSDFVCKYYE